MIPREFLGLYLAANAFALAVLAVAFWRRDIARWTVVGVFGWAACINTWTALAQPELYLDYATLTVSSWYRDFILGWFSRHVSPVVITIAAGQLLVAGLLASPVRAHRWIGATGAWMFLAAITPLGVGAGLPFSLTFGAALFVSIEGVEVHAATLRRFVRFLPRLLGVVIVTFMALLALDAIVAGQTTLDTIRGFGMHLVPAGIVLVALLIGWRWPWAGGVLCFALAVGYGFLADGRVSWMLAISLPLVVEGVLFLWSARIDRHSYAGRVS
jgi:hypothetical protein